jgi:chromosome segregation ATPase
MMSYDAMISTYEKDIRVKDAEIARLRTELAQKIAIIESMQKTAAEICDYEDAENDRDTLRTERDAPRAELANVRSDQDEHLDSVGELSAQLATAREALEEIALNCDPADPPWADTEKGRIQTGDIARAALSRLSSLGVQQHAGKAEE